MIDLHAIRQAHPLPSIVGVAVKLHRTGAEWKGCCPFHADRSPSFTIYDHGCRWHCFGCGASGDVLDYVQRLHGVGLIEAAEMLEGGKLPMVPHIQSAPARRSDRTAEACSIWESAQPADGTLAETYLRARGIAVPIPPSIRYALISAGKPPLSQC